MGISSAKNTAKSLAIYQEGFESWPKLGRITENRFLMCNCKEQSTTTNIKITTQKSLKQKITHLSKK